MSERPLIVGWSGGKDSTAMALRLAELSEDFRLLYTPTGNELPEMKDHMSSVVEMLGVDLIELDVPTLEELIREQSCLPSHRMRWCTRIIKIEPVVKWFRDEAEEGRCYTIAIGLRADEPGRMGGIYGPETTVRFPLREWGWGIEEVVDYCRERGVTIPRRTDCAVCFDQRLWEWYVLWMDYPEEWAQAVAWEDEVGHTFRNPKKDNHPGDLRGLGEKFARGFVPRTRAPGRRRCRLCSM